MNQSHIFLDELAFLNGLRQAGGSGLGAGENHYSAYVFVQPVYRVDFTAQGFLQSGGHLNFGIQPHRLDAQDNVPVGKENFHG